MLQVESVIRELGLIHAADTPIGTVTRKGISGGERKRVRINGIKHFRRSNFLLFFLYDKLISQVNIGVELITDPSLLFLDEPTSGLDSFTAYNIMETLIALARAGRTVVCTIHQPRSNIYHLFDMVMLLSAGQVVYFGPANHAVEYFAQLGYVCPQV